MAERTAPWEEPFLRFREIFDQAVATGMADPDAMVVSTVDPGGQPSSRVVLLKSFDERGFVFFTNLESRKGREIRGNPKVSLSFFWRELSRQVVVLGEAQPVTDAEADAYFRSRSRGSQLGAWASLQSRPLHSRAHLLADVAKLEAKYLTRAVPRPPHWSGWRVVPSWIELWTAGAFRLHHRTVYERAGDAAQGWLVSTLYP